MIIDLKESLAEFEIAVKTVLHIGAHHGQEDTVYQDLDITPIYVEANPAVFEVLRSNVPERECHNVAISNYIGTTKFHVTSFDQSSSVLPLKGHKKIYPGIVEEKQIEVPCTTIDELAESSGKTIDMLNMDIQGAELLALQGATRTLENVQCIMTEVNKAELYEGCGLMKDLDQFLKPFDFQRVQSDFKYHKTWGDAFYVRSRYVPQVSVAASVKKAFKTVLKYGRVG